MDKIYEPINFLKENIRNNYVLLAASMIKAYIIIIMRSIIVN